MSTSCSKFFLWCLPPKAERRLRLCCRNYVLGGVGCQHECSRIPCQLGAHAVKALMGCGSPSHVCRLQSFKHDHARHLQARGCTLWTSQEVKKCGGTPTLPNRFSYSQLVEEQNLLNTPLFLLKIIIYYVWTSFVLINSTLKVLMATLMKEAVV